MIINGKFLNSLNQQLVVKDFLFMNMPKTLGQKSYLHITKQLGFNLINNMAEKVGFEPTIG